MYVHVEWVQDHYVTIKRNWERQDDCTSIRKTSFHYSTYIERVRSEMKAAEGLYVMVVKSLGIEKIDEEEKPNIIIPKQVQPLLAEFS